MASKARVRKRFALYPNGLPENPTNPLGVPVVLWAGFRSGAALAPRLHRAAYVGRRQPRQRPVPVTVSPLVPCSVRAAAALVSGSVAAVCGEGRHGAESADMMVHRGRPEVAGRGTDTARVLTTT